MIVISFDKLFCLVTMLKISILDSNFILKLELIEFEIFNPIYLFFYNFSIFDNTHTN